MKYFDPKTIFLARHAQHIVVVHFPIALLISSVAFDLLAGVTRRSALAIAGACNLYAAALAAPIAAVTGFLAWRWQLEGARFKGPLLLHVCAAAVVILLCWILAWMRLRRRDPVASLSFGFCVLGIIAVFAVAVTAHFGGIVSGVVTLAN